MNKLLEVLLLLSAFVLSSCGTMEGLGKDIQNAGEALEKKAKDY